MHELSTGIIRKFTESYNIDDFEIDTDTGWQDISAIHKTIPYEKYHLETVDGLFLDCADDHIIFDRDWNEVFVKDVKPGSIIITEKGFSTVKESVNCKCKEEMFDITVDSDDHRYFTNGILSHNTTILNAIAFAFYDKTLSGVSKSNVMNKTNANVKGAEMVVQLRLKKDADFYDIIRTQKKNSNTVTIIKNDDPDNQISTDGIRNDNKFIEENIISMSFELFKRRVVFTGGDEPFFRLDLSKQRSVIEELFDITEISEKAEKLKEINKTLDKNVAIKEAVINEQKIAQATRVKQLESARKRVSDWDEERVLNIQSYKKQINQYEEVDFEGAEEIHIAVSEYEEKFIAPIKKDISIIDSSISSVKRDIANITSNIAKLIKESDKKKSEIEHLSDSKCPYCSQHFTKANEKIKVCEADIEKLSIEISNLGAEIEIKNEELQVINDAREKMIADLTEKNGDYEALLSAKKVIPDLLTINKIKRELPTLQIKIAELENSTNPHVTALKELEEYEDIKIDTKELDDLKNEIEHNKFLLKLLTDKNSFIRKKIISKNISKLNQRLQYYLDKFGLPHLVTFTPDMYCEITEYDRVLDYGNLSGGEQKRINLALAFAFGDVGADLSEKINVMFTDEIDGGAICQNGMENIIKVLKDKAAEDDIGLWIISHRAEMANRFANELTVIKENGFTHIE